MESWKQAWTVVPAFVIADIAANPNDFRHPQWVSLHDLELDLKR